MLLRFARASAPQLRAAARPVPRAAAAPRWLSSAPEGAAATHELSAAASDADDGARRRKLIYRSKQRGWLEVDLLLGTWATRHVPTLDEEGLKQYEQLLACETLDIFQYMTCREEAPDHVKSPLLLEIQAWARSKPLGVGEAAYEAAKRESGLT